MPEVKIYTYGEVCNLYDKTLARGKEDGIKVGIAYSMGLFAKMATEAGKACTQSGNLIERNNILRSLIAEIFEAGVLTRDDEYEKLLVSNLMKGVWDTPYPTGDSK